MIAPAQLACESLSVEFKCYCAKLPSREHVEELVCPADTSEL